MKKVLVLLICLVLLAGMAPLVSGASDPAAIASQYVRHLAAGNFTAAVAMQDAQMKAAAGEAALESLWAGLTKQVGAFKEARSPYLESKNGYLLAFVPCSFESGVVDILVVVNAEGLISGLQFMPHQERAAWAAPSYADAAKFTETEIVFGEKGWELKGTLTRPRGLAKYPVVVLVHGSGPNDREETIGPNKVFKDLAWGLASKGIAVFRYDKRTAVYAEKMDPFSVTVEEEVIDDAVAAVRLARDLPQAKAVYVLGHSLGGILAAGIARESGADGAVIMAGSPRPLDQIIADQLAYLTRLDGKVTPEEQAIIDDFNAKDVKLNAGTLAPDEMMFGMSGCYWSSLLKHDPLAETKAFGKPMLFLQGERDYQVLMKDFALWKNGLTGSLYTFRSYPSLNHAFMPGQGQPTPDEYQKINHVDAQVVGDIAAWILQR